jgi:hypothetical protein
VKNITVANNEGDQQRLRRLALLAGFRLAQQIGAVQRRVVTAETSEADYRSACARSPSRRWNIRRAVTTLRSKSWFFDAEIGPRFASRSTPSGMLTVHDVAVEIRARWRGMDRASATAFKTGR